MNNTSKAKGIVSLVMGIMSFLSIFGFNYIFAIVALVLGSKAKNTSGEKLGKVGALLGKINIIVVSILLVVTILLAVLFTIIGLMSM